MKVVHQKLCKIGFFTSSQGGHYKFVYVRPQVWQAGGGGSGKYRARPIHLSQVTSAIEAYRAPALIIDYVNPVPLSRANGAYRAPILVF